jgi:hypothetical protein
MGSARVIPTLYQGINFRSRNEARWAVYFDALGLAWQYEPEGYFVNGRGYLPDFWLPELDCFAEVKSGTFTSEEWALCCGLPKPCVILDGPPAARAWACTGTDATPTYDAYLGGEQYGQIALAHSLSWRRLFFLMGDNYQDLRSSWEECPAVASALSARFEHGERPVTESKQWQTDNRLTPRLQPSPI